MFKKLFPLFVLALTSAFFSCSEDDNPAAPAEISNVLYVVNNLGETISLIDLDTDSVFNDIYTTGGSPAEIDFANGSIYVVNSNDNTTQKIDVYSGNSYFISLGEYKNPSHFEFIGGGKIAVSNFVSGTVQFIDDETGYIEDEIEVGNGIWGMVFHAGKLYVGITNIIWDPFGYGQGQVAVIDADSRSVIDIIDTGINPGILFVDAQDEINVVCIGNEWDGIESEIYRINPDDNSIAGSFFLGGNPSFAAMNNDGIVYLPGGWGENSYLLSYDSNSESIIHGGGSAQTIPGNSGAQGITLDSDGNLYICCFMSNTVVKIDADGNILHTYDVGDGPQTIVYVD